MEKAILKTLIYADIFDYPLKIEEIHRWLISKKATLRQVEKTLERLNHKARIENQGEYYFLPKREKAVTKRKHRGRESRKYFKKAQRVAFALKLVPWVKLVGISGGLAMGNAYSKDDIDLFIITAKDRLWISRLFILGLLSLTGQRRKRQDRGRQIAGKICVNILLEEDRLKQKNKDVYVAHELLQMRLLWQRQNVYSKYLERNGWAFKFLPNWMTDVRQESRIRQKNHNSLFMLHDSLIGLLENFAKWLQLKIMKEPTGMERIEEGAAYFHPADCRQEILACYQKRVNGLML